jgi:hypothetical protein
MRGKLNAIAKRLDALDPPPDGCDNCRGCPERVEVYDGEPEPDGPPCLNPGACPGRVRRIVVRHHGTERDSIARLVQTTPTEATT